MTLVPDGGVNMKTVPGGGVNIMSCVPEGGVKAYQWYMV